MNGSLLTLAPFVSHRAYTLWRLESHKTDATKPPVKVPVHYDGTTHHSTAQPAAPMSASECIAWLDHNRDAGTGHARVGEVGYLGAGFRPGGTGLVCVDLDDCVAPDGQWMPGASTLMSMLPGGLIEQSVSGRGAHIWVSVKGAGPGRLGKRTTPLGAVEIYGDGQFIAAGTVLGGDASVDHTEAIARLAANYWPPVLITDRMASPADWDSKTQAQQAATLADVRSALATLDADNRDEWIAAGQALRSLGDAGFAMWAEWSATSSRFPGGDGLDKWETLSGERTDYRAVIAKAQRIGWVNPAAGAPVPADPAALFTQSAAVPVGMLLERPASNPITLPADGMPYVGTEDALAEEFVNKHASKYLYVPGLDWVVRSGPIFQRDEALRRYSDLRPIAREASKLGGAKKLGSAGAMHGSLSIARSDRRIQAQVSEFDADPYELNTPDGVLDLRTGAMRAHRDEDRFMQVAPCAPTSSPCSDWLAFVESVFIEPALVDFMQRSAGYWLTGDRSAQVLWFLHGVGSNGKSTYLGAVHHAMGHYATKMPAAALMQRKGERHPTELAALRGKRLAVSNELPAGEHLNEALIKELTGDDMVSARLMRQDFMEFALKQKHVLAGNFKPRLHGGDAAMGRRLLLVGLHARFEGSAMNTSLLDKFKADPRGALHWMVEGAAKWHADGGGLRGLRVPASVTGDSAEYLAAHDDVAQWVDERCVRTGSVKASIAYADFRAWKATRGESPQSIVRFSEQLLNVPGIRREKSSVVFYHGLAVTVGGFMP